MDSTIYDVARLAGVSLSTVSRVLNHHPYVRTATREKVMQAIEALNFKPSHVASALATNQTRTFGLLVSDISNPFFAEVVRGVEAAGADHGFSLVICNTDGDREREVRHLTTLRQKGVDGIIFACTQLNGAEIVSLLGGASPIVLIAQEVEGLAADVIRVDDFQGGYEAVKHLVSLGHRRIAYITGPVDNGPVRGRKKGYEAGLEAAGIEVNPELIVTTDNSLDGGYNGFQQLLTRVDPLPTAVFCINDLVAIGVIKAARRNGLRVPEDLSVVGYDRTPLAGMVEPELTSVAQPVREMGRWAVDVLVNRVGQNPVKTQRVVMEPELIRGGSTMAITNS